MGKSGSSQDEDRIAAGGSDGAKAPTEQLEGANADLRALLVEVRDEFAALRRELPSAGRPDPSPKRAARPVAADQLARLALFDEMMGLRAELAQARVHSEMAGEGTELVRLRQRVRDCEAEVAALRASRSWRVGQAVLSPARAARRLWRR